MSAYYCYLAPIGGLNSITYMLQSVHGNCLCLPFYEHVSMHFHCPAFLKYSLLFCPSRTHYFTSLCLQFQVPPTAARFRIRTFVSHKMSRNGTKSESAASVSGLFYVRSSSSPAEGSSVFSSCVGSYIFFPPTLSPAIVLPSSIVSTVTPTSDD